MCIPIFPLALLLMRRAVGVLTGENKLGGAVGVVVVVVVLVVALDVISGKLSGEVRCGGSLTPLNFIDADETVSGCCDEGEGAGEGEGEGEGVMRKRGFGFESLCADCSSRAASIKMRLALPPLPSAVEKEEEVMGSDMDKLAPLHTALSRCRRSAPASSPARAFVSASRVLRSPADSARTYLADAALVVAMAFLVIEAAVVVEVDVAGRGGKAPSPFGGRVEYDKFLRIGECKGEEAVAGRHREGDEGVEEHGEGEHVFSPESSPPPPPPPPPIFLSAAVRCSQLSSCLPLVGEQPNTHGPSTEASTRVAPRLR